MGLLFSHPYTYFCLAITGFFSIMFCNSINADFDFDQTVIIDKNIVSNARKNMILISKSFKPMLKLDSK